MRLRKIEAREREARRVEFRRKAVAITLSLVCYAAIGGIVVAIAWGVM